MTRRGHQIGPVPQSEIEAMMRNGGADGDTYVFTAGMTEWLRLKEVDAFRPLLAGDGSGPIPAPPGKTAAGRPDPLRGAQTRRRRRGEGSVLDNLGIGNLVDGQ